MAVTDRQVRAGALALMSRSAGAVGVVLTEDDILRIPDVVLDEALADARAVLDAAEKASLIILPGDNHG